jgi:hypothetical protein
VGQGWDEVEWVNGEEMGVGVRGKKNAVGV